jgi:predicted O-linked N-acetylglucosamine transferase (SPINDLY family)
MPSSIETLLQQAQTQISKGKLDLATRTLKQALKMNATSAQAHHYLGLIQFQKRNYEAATHLLSEALRLDGTDPLVHNNAGLVWMTTGNQSKAITSFEAAVALDPLYFEAWMNLGNVKQAAGQLPEAKRNFEHVLALNPYYADAINNLGLTLRQMGELAPAVEQFERCIEIAPTHHFALNNLGLALQAQGKSDAAQTQYEAALQVAPNYIEAHINYGHLLEQQGRYAQALEHYQVAYRRAPDLDLLAGYITQAKSMLCDWSDLDSLCSKIKKQIERGHVPCSPLALLSLTDDSKLSLQLAQSFTQQHTKTPQVESWQPKAHRPEQKIRIGYISSDFREHPVAYLMVGILEHHNRDKFEVIGFSLGKPQTEGLGLRMRNSVDQFIDLSQCTDTQAVEQIRSQHLDIAIDLNGYIEGCRPGILKARVAPVQVNYYGYPGTMGADFMDYIVGDPVLIPPQTRDHYQEKIIYLPDCYQPNDDQRIVSNAPSNRATHGLPEHGFIFCCFNKPYKITQPIFNSWMHILSAVEHSVLWLQSTDETVVSNLRKAAKKAGVDSSRLVFAGRTPTTAEHLARYRLADLFLDTYPYTAHTTGNDALWTGLPVLAMTGQTFSSRVSESLLTSLGLNGLVMNSLQQYQETAVALARNPETMQQWKHTLEQGKQEGSLYKPARITQWLEAGLTAAIERFRMQQPADHIFVKRD